MLDIWHILPRGMRSMMCHVVGALTLIQRLLYDDQSTLFFDDDVPDATPHHDSPPTHGSGEQSPSSHSPPYASQDAPFNDLPMLLILPSPPPSPLLLVATPSINIPPPPPPYSPLHVSQASSSVDPPPPRPHVSPV